MIPAPGETPGEWWDATGWSAQRDHATFDAERDFLHDVPADVLAAGERHQRPEADIVFGQPCAFERWPDVPTTVLAGRDDRFFPFAFQRRSRASGSGSTWRRCPAEHLAALSQPEAVARRASQVERAQPVGVGEDVDLDDPLARDREAGDRERPLRRRHDEAGGPLTSAGRACRDRASVASRPGRSRRPRRG